MGKVSFRGLTGSMLAPRRGSGRRAILHIGTEKTGTTTLQTAFAADSERLSKAGVCYPPLGGGAAHTGLAIYAADHDEMVADLGALAGVLPGETRGAFGARLEAMLARETAQHPDCRFVFSTEHAQARLASDTSVGRLKALLHRYFDSVTIVVYLRRWDRVALAFHSTEMRNGSTGPFSFERFRESTYLDYVGLLDRWSGAFGRDNVAPAIYARSELTGGSILDDFTCRNGLPALSPIAECNRSLGAAALAELEGLNAALTGVDPVIAAAIREAALARSGRAGGYSGLVSRAQAAAFLRTFAGQEAALLERYFPERPRLFDLDMAEYPLAIEAAASDRALSQTLIGALAETVTRHRATTAELQYYRARMHHDRGAHGLALAEIVGAVAVEPHNPAFLHVLALAHTALARPESARAAILSAIALQPDNEAHRGVLARIEALEIELAG